MFPRHTAVNATAIPNNDSCIDITSPKREDFNKTVPFKKKSVSINSAPPQVYDARSPSLSQGSIDSREGVGNGFGNHNNNGRMGTINEDNSSQQFTSSLPHSNPQSSSSTSTAITTATQPQRLVHDKYAQHVLSPLEYVILALSKIYNVGFLIGHIILHGFILALLCYTVIKTPDDEQLSNTIDGFSVFLFFNTALQLTMVAVAIITHQSTELALQIAAVVTGLATISQTLTAFLWCFLFDKIVESMKGTADSAVRSTTLVNLYDLLSSFYTLMIIIQFLDLGGLFGSLFSVYYRIKHVYSLVPTQKINIHTILGLKNQNEEGTTVDNNTISNPSTTSTDIDHTKASINNDNTAITPEEYAPTPLASQSSPVDPLNAPVDKKKSKKKGQGVEMAVA